jgi:hypothetical protein
MCPVHLAGGHRSCDGNTSERERQEEVVDVRKKKDMPQSDLLFGLFVCDNDGPSVWSERDTSRRSRR